MTVLATKMNATVAAEPTRVPPSQRSVPYTEMVEITPELAETWIRRNAKNNRSLSRVTIGTYAAEMREGLWRVTGQGIIFDTDGRLIDGQHRLAAIMESGVTVTMTVTRNVNPEAICAIDSGRARTVRDSNRVAGRGDWSLLEYAAGYIMSAGLASNNRRNAKVPRSLSSEMMSFYSDAVRFGVESVSGGSHRLKSSLVIAQISRAWYTQDRGELSKFGHIYASGMSNGEPRDSAPVLLRNLMLEKGHSSQRSGVSRKDIYYKAGRAIEAYLAHEEIKLLKTKISLYFPIPNWRDPSEEI